MLEYFDKLLFNALVEYNAMINRCMDDPAFADTVCDSGIGDAIEHYMMEIVSSAENAGAISLDDWRTLRHTIGFIGYADADPDLDLDLDLYVTLRYEVEA